MKLLLIGTDEVWAIENYFIKYLSKWLPDIQNGRSHKVGYTLPITFPNN